MIHKYLQVIHPIMVFMPLIQKAVNKKEQMFNSF